MKILIASAGLAVAFAVSAIGTPDGARAANLVTNGDFEAGNVGFTSDYTYSPGNGFPASTYTVTNNPRSWNRNFVMAGDHTTGSGLMFVANGSPDVGDIVWESSPIVIGGSTKYFFEAFVMNVFPSNPPNLTFTVSLDGGAEQVLNTLTVPNTTGVWNGLSTSFNSGTATTASLFLRNAQTAFGGNDFAIDDIFLGTQSFVNPPAGVPEPATWAMLIAGFGLVGGAMRRRHSTAMVCA